MKSLLDVPATLEVLETLGVPVLGFRTDALPLFYSAHGGPPVPARVDTAQRPRGSPGALGAGGGGLIRSRGRPTTASTTSSR